MKYTLFCTAIASMISTAAARQSATAPSNVTLLRTPAGAVDIALLNPRPAAPAPTLIVLSGVAQDTLAKSSFLQAGRALVPKGYLCVSIDLPCHGSQESKGVKGLSGWGKRAAAGDDFVAEFNQRMSSALDYLIKEGLTDPNKIAVCGTSRGGFLAIRFAAHDKRVKCAVGYSPVTNLRMLSEFRNASSVPGIDAMSLEAFVGELVGRPIFIVIGDRDQRVGTDAAIHFARALSAAAVEKQVPSLVELHVISEPKADHTTPMHADEWSAKWIERVLGNAEKR